MKIQLEQIDVDSAKPFEFLQKWHNDRNLRHKILWNVSEVDLRNFDDKLKIRQQYIKNKQNYFYFLIMADDEYIGEASFTIAPPYLFKKDPTTAFIRLYIGESKFDQHEILLSAIHLLEEESFAKGANFCEIGAIEFDYKKIEWIKKAEYQEIGRFPQFSFWKNKMWSEIRYKKTLRQNRII